MLPQAVMIERLRELCQQDERLQAAMLYGSFPLGEADRYSDIDCMLFFADEALPEVDQRAWVTRISPVELFYVNEFGNRVAIFDNLVRAEFHFDPASQMQQLESYRGRVWFPSIESTLLLDRTGELAQHLQALLDPLFSHDTPEDALFLCNTFLNWFLFGSNVLIRGERARALEILHIVQDNLLCMVRLLEGSTRHWITPTRSLEQEISAPAYRRYQACTARLDQEALREAYSSAWAWGNELMTILSEHYTTPLPDGLIEKIGRNLLSDSEAF